MFRGTAAMFATDPLVLPVAKSLVSSGKDKEMTPHERLFIYMCIQHSEVLDDVILAESLLRALAIESDDDAGKMYNGILKSAGAHVEMLRRKLTVLRFSLLFSSSALQISAATATGMRCSNEPARPPNSSTSRHTQMSHGFALFNHRLRQPTASPLITSLSGSSCCTASARTLGSSLKL